MVMEAVAIKVNNEDGKQEEKKEKTDWKRDPEALKRLRGM